MARYEVNGFPNDGFLRLPFDFIDLHMADFSGSELLVMLYILRRTVGFHKSTDNISLQQFSKGIQRVDGSVLDRGTGLGLTAVKTTLAGLEARGFLSRKRVTRTRTGADGPTRILLHWDRVMCTRTATAASPTVTRGSRNPTRGVAGIRPGGSRNPATQ